MKTITRSFTAERAADGLVTLSTETPCDQDGLVLKAEGWDLSRFEKVAPKMFYNHATWSSEDFPIGRWEDVQVKDGKLVGRPVFAAEEHPERAGVIAKLWDGGFLDDVSVSFRVDPKALAGPLKFGEREYQISGHHELLECSIVGIGADPNAGKGRLAEAVTRGVLTREEAESIAGPEREPHGNQDDMTEQLRRMAAALEQMQTEAASLRKELESVREQIGRLEAQKEQPREQPAAVRVLRAEGNEGKGEKSVPEETIRASVQGAMAAAIRATTERQLRLMRGQLPD